MQMTEQDRKTIISDPKIAMGKPVVSGTRITVELILENLGAGETLEDLVEAHPRLTREGVNAALAYAAAVLKNEEVHAVGSEAA